MNDNDIDDIMTRLESLVKNIMGSLRQLAKTKIAYSNDEVSKMFGVSKQTLRKWRDRGCIGFSKCGNVIMYSKRDIEEFLADNHYDKFDRDS